MGHNAAQTNVFLGTTVPSENVKSFRALRVSLADDVGPSVNKYASDRYNGLRTDC